MKPGYSKPSSRLTLWPLEIIAAPESFSQASGLCTAFAFVPGLQQGSYGVEVLRLAVEGFKTRGYFGLPVPHRPSHNPVCCMGTYILRNSNFSQQLNTKNVGSNINPQLNMCNALCSFLCRWILFFSGAPLAARSEEHLRLVTAEPSHNTPDITR